VLVGITIKAILLNRVGTIILPSNKYSRLSPKQIQYCLAAVVSIIISIILYSAYTYIIPAINIPAAPILGIIP